ncbi:MAG: hypothetical protein PQJ58_22095 [Spirochaetales bacterium]|nr:hypothetical protein [Spirochaetales bacterium]
MKYYTLETAESINGITPPGMDGRHVKAKETIFNKACGPDRFFKEPPVFDYLVPLNFHEDDEDKEPVMIYDYNYWWGEPPRGGWQKPVSQKFREIIGQFNLGAHQFYPATVLYKGVEHQYYVLQVLRNYHKQFISYEHTLFNNLNSSRELEGENLEIKQFACFNDLESYSENHWDWEWNYERIVMKPDFRKLDFVPFYQFGDLVSEPLKCAIEDAALTGVEFHELPIPIEFSDQI